MRSLILAALVLAIAVPAVAGDYQRGHRHRPSTGSYLANRGIVGGRAVSSDYYRPYPYRPHGFSTYGYDRRPRDRERIIILEREVVPSGRWRR